MKKALSVLIALAVFLLAISCSSGSSAPAPTASSEVLLKVDVKTDRAISEIEKYGDLYALMMAGNETEITFVDAFKITKQESSIEQKVKLPSGESNIIVYLMAGPDTESQTENMNSLKHNEDIATADVEVSITTESGDRYAKVSTLTIYAEDVSYNQYSTNEAVGDLDRTISTTEIFIAKGSTTRFDFHNEV